MRSITKVVSFPQKLTRLLPNFPRRRYNIFTGTNTWREWRLMVHAWLSGGPYDNLDVIANYERQFAKICGVRHGISFGAGRMALYAILQALDIKDNDEVIIPAFTCVVVPNAILYRGARPVYVDIEPSYFNIDVAKVIAAITPRTKALYAQHTFGVPCDVDALRDIGRRYGLPIIEDAAHALGATYEGKPVGSLTEIAFFSTDHTKVINTHLGGMAITDNDELAARLKKVQSRAPFLEPRLTRRLIQSFLIEYLCFAPRFLWLGGIVYSVLARLRLLFYFHDELELQKPTGSLYPCRLSSTQAQLGLSQLEHLQSNLTHRREIAQWLEKQIRWSEMKPDEINNSTWLRYSFLVRDRARFEKLFSKHLDLAIWFDSIVSGRSQDLEAVGYQSGTCPVAEYVVQHIANFQTHMRVPLAILRKEVDRNWYWLNREILHGSNG